MIEVDLKKETRRLKKWIEQKEYFDSTVQRVEQYLKDTLRTAGLLGLSSWYGHLGNLSVLEGNAIGWEYLKRSFDYDAIGIRILAAKQDMGKFRHFISEEIAIWLSFAVAFRLDSFAIWLGDRIIESIESKADKVKLGPPDSPYYFAFVQFYSLWQKKSFNIKDHSNESLGIYQELLDGWQDEKHYLKACSKACDYHVKRMHDDGGYSEFLGAPQDLLPVEMLMIRRIREDHGLPNPEIDHPLMQTPLGKAPKRLPEVKDELLERVIAKARKELDHFPDF
jgi:hypothetical protein